MYDKCCLILILMQRDRVSVDLSIDKNGKIQIYQNEKGDTKIDVFFEDETVWMTRKSIAELHQTTPQNITLHVKNIYQDGELEEKSITCKFKKRVPEA